MEMEVFGRFDALETQLPPGFRFHPTDEELITYYLMKKVLDSSFTGRAIAEVDLNKCEPWQLPGTNANASLDHLSHIFAFIFNNSLQESCAEKAKMGEKEWYFFSLRDRKYPTGLRTNRATGAGYWKATGKDREIHSSKTGCLVGMKKTLVFYRGRAPKGEKSNWVMHEYRLEGKLSYHYLSRSSKDEWVVSRVFQKSFGGGGGGSSGGKKARIGSSSSSVFAEVGSPASSSIPPLLESSPYAVASSGATATAATDKESCCYDESESSKEHVSCFSTINTHAMLLGSSTALADLTAQFAGRSGGGGGPTFPSLRALQDNLQLPGFFYSAVAPMGMAPTTTTSAAAAAAASMAPSSSDQMGGCSSLGGSWAEVDQKVMDRSRQQLQMGGGGSDHLDCMWTY
ncbi:hypothetical protein ACLOJK_009809 [Asimina triloba]